MPSVSGEDPARLTREPGRARWLLALALALTLGLGAPASAQGRVVKVGLYENPPKVFTDEAGAPAGIFVDVVEHVAREEGWTLEYVPGTWEQGLRRLDAGELDLMPDVAFEADRADRFRFHDVPVLSSWSQVYVARGNEVRSLLDLQGRRVALLSGSVQERAFSQIASGFGLEVALVTAADNASVFQAVRDGEADAAVANNFFGHVNARKFGLEDTAVIFHPARLHFAAPRGGDPAVLESVDRHLRALKQDPSSVYHRSLRRWVSNEPAFALPAWVKVTGLGAGAALLLFLVGSLALKHQVDARTRELSTRNEQLAAIGAALRATTTQLDLQAIAEGALRAARGLTGLEGGVVYLADGETGRLVARAVVDPDGSADGGPPRSAEELVGAAGGRAGRARVLSERAATGAAAGGDGVAFLAVFALRARGEEIGALCLFTRRGERPGAAALDLVEEVCAPVALTIQNALLFERVKHHEEDLTRQVAERTEELERAMVEAQAADHLKSAFLATMSHELRTPLNSIIGFTGILLKELAGPLSAEQSKQLTMVQRSARHLLSLINDVLDLSKIEAGQLELRAAPFELALAVQAVASMVAPQAGAKGIELAVDVADGVGQVTADRRRLEQVMLNLLGNAIKFTDQGAVRVSCVADGEGCVFSVSDTGIGIRPEDLPGLFRPFHQLDSGLARKREGTGLGLSICKRLVDMMGGSIAVESQPGRGSTFTVRFPRHAPEVA